jgi:hypothetical protein
MALTRRRFPCASSVCWGYTAPDFAEPDCAGPDFGDPDCVELDIGATVDAPDLGELDLIVTNVLG